MMLIYAAVLAGCIVTDGDTIRCGDERFRLLAIQAPDKPSAAGCRRRDPAYVCNTRLAAASKAHLEGLVRGQLLRVYRIRAGAWGRADVMVYLRHSNVSLNCHQIRSGHATYWAKYDHRGRLKKECRLGR